MKKRMYIGGVRIFSSCDELGQDFGASHYFDGLPAQRELEAKLTRLLGRPTLATTRGMTAISAAVQMLAGAEHTIVCSEDVYPGTRKYLNEFAERWLNRQVVWFDPINPNRVLNEIDGSGLVFTEVIGNSRQMRVADVKFLEAVCRERVWPLVVDTTFTPQFRVEEDSPTIIVASMTKWHQAGDAEQGGLISGPAEVIGALADSQAYNIVRMSPRVANHFSEGVGQTMRRYRKACRATQSFAEIFSKSTAVEQVWYPGLESHPGHLFCNEFGGLAGGVFYVQMKGGEKAAVKLTDTLANQQPYRSFRIGVSFGALDCRLLPWVGPLRKHTDVDGLVRVSPGWGMSLKKDQALLRQVLKSLE